MGKRLYLNNEWKFTHGFDEEMLRVDYSEENMEEVRLPHTNVELPFHYFDEEDYQELSCYRRHIYAEPEWEGQSVELTLEGAAHQSCVYVNGKLAKVHSCGYTACRVDLTELLSYGENNLVTVKLDSRESLNIPPFGKVIDYMTYGGIYRDVYLTILNRTHLKDVFVYADVSDDGKGRLNLSADVTDATEDLLVKVTIAPSDTEFVREHPVGDVRLAGSVIKVVNGRASRKIAVKDMELWTVEKPYLYDVKLSLYQGDLLLDDVTVRCGFRTAVFKKDGFYLNGEKLKLRGMDRHQCYPYVGYAMPASMQRYDADIMKNELSLNAVRTSHYPDSHSFFDRCDEIGLLAFTEIPGWQHIGDAMWKDQAVENTRDMVLQYRNHPSIILWGVRINESRDDDEFYARTNRAAHELDPYRQTGGVRNFMKSHLLEDVYTYNEFCHTGDNQAVDSKKKVTSDMNKPYLISEYNGHMYPTKPYDDEEHRLEHALRHARVINEVAGYEDISGSFGWCMFDYNTHRDFGSGDRICYHGIMDMYRNPKMAAAVYESQRDVEQGAVLEISSSMDIGEHPAGNLTKVYAFTNADAIRLYKNGDFIREFSDSEFQHLEHGPILIDDFVGNLLEEKEGFAPAKAEAVKGLLLDAARYGLSNLPMSAKLNAAKLLAVYRMTYDDCVGLYEKYIGNWGERVTSYRFDAISDGEVIASVVREPVTEVKIKTVVSHDVLKEGNTYDVAAVRIMAVDQNDNVLPYFMEPVELSVTGAVQLIGPKVISLKGGMGGTYVKTKGSSGRATLTIHADGCEPVKVKFTVENKG